MDDMPAIATVSRYNENGRRGAGNTADGLTTHLNRARRAGMNATHKTCTKCGESKPLDEFHRDRSKSDGRLPHCRACKAAYRLVNRERNYRQFAEYRAAHRDEQSARNARWVAGHREEIAEYRATNRDRIEANRKRYVAAHPEISWRGNYRSRATRYGFDIIEEEFTKGDVIALYGDGCAYCGEPFEQLDHYVSIKNGGPHTLANVRPSCTSCNRSKRDINGDEFRALNAER